MFDPVGVEVPLYMLFSRICCTTEREQPRLIALLKKQ